MDYKKDAQALWDSFGSEQSPHDDVEAITKALADASAAGYAEAIEKAAKLLDVAAASIHPELQLHERYDAIKKFATSTAATVRKLALAATTKEPK